MNSRVFIAALAGAIASFILGWIIYGMLIGEFYSAHMLHYPGLMKTEPNLLGLFLSCFAYALILAMIFGNWANITNIRNGALAGLSISMLFAISIDLNLWSTLNLYGKRVIIADVLINAVTGAIIGAIIAWILGYKNTN